MEKHYNLQLWKTNNTGLEKYKVDGRRGGGNGFNDHKKNDVQLQRHLGMQDFTTERMGYRGPEYKETY